MANKKIKFLIVFVIVFFVYKLLSSFMVIGWTPKYINANLPSVDTVNGRNCDIQFINDPFSINFSDSIILNLCGYQLYSGEYKDELEKCKIPKGSMNCGWELIVYHNNVPYVFQTKDAVKINNENNVRLNIEFTLFKVASEKISMSQL